MRSRIFSSKYIRTISKGKAWIPAFLTLGFLLAFPVTGLVKLGSWQNMEYTVDQMGVLYNPLWKDGFVLAGLFVSAIAAFMNSVNGFIYLYSGKKTDFYHGLPLKRSEIFTEKTVTGLLYYLIPYVIMEFLAVCIGAARGFFQSEYCGYGCQNAASASADLSGDLFQHCAHHQRDGKYADGYSMSGRDVPVWYCAQSDSCSLWTVILAYLLLGIPVWWL